MPSEDINNPGRELFEWRTQMEVKIQKVSDEIGKVHEVATLTKELDRKFERLLTCLEFNTNRTDELMSDNKTLTKLSQTVAMHHDWICGSGHDPGLKARVMDLERVSDPKLGERVSVIEKRTDERLTAVEKTMHSNSAVWGAIGAILTFIGGAIAYLSGHIGGLTWK